MSIPQVITNVAADYFPAEVPKLQLPAPILEFDKYVFKKNEVIPKNLDLRGAIIVERDTKHHGFLHVLLWIFQKIHAFFCGTKGVDSNMGHGSIIMGHGKRENELLINHSALSRGVATSKLNFTTHKLSTEIYIYVPKNNALKDMVATHCAQTCYDRNGLHGRVSQKNMSRFSVADMMAAPFCRMRKNPNESTLRRTAAVVTDLLMGQQFLNARGNAPQNFFCTPYIASLLVGSHLIQNLKEGEKELLLEKRSGEKRTRKEVADLIYHSISKKIPTNSLSAAYWENEICRQNLRYLMSGQFVRMLDNSSTLRNNADIQPVPAEVENQ